MMAAEKHSAVEGTVEDAGSRPSPEVLLNSRMGGHDDGLLFWGFVLQCRRHPSPAPGRTAPGGVEEPPGLLSSLISFQVRDDVGPAKSLDTTLRTTGFRQRGWITLGAG